MLEELLNREDISEDVKEEIRRNISERDNNNNNNNNNKLFNNYLNNIINAIGDPLFVKDDNYRFILANDALCQMVGIKREDIIGKTLAESLPKDQMDHFLEVDKMVLDLGLENQCEELLTGHDGKIKTIVTKKTRYINEQGDKFLVGVIHDISERKKVEQQIQFQSNLLKNVSDAIIATDTQYNITFWNKMAEKQYGWTAVEVIGQPMEKFIINDYLGCSLDVIIQKISQDGHWIGEVTQNRRDGVRIPILSTLSIIKNGQNPPAGFIAINRDITKQKQLENILQKSSDYSRNLIESSLDPLVTINQLGKITDVNIATEKVTGVIRDNLIGSDFSNYFTEPEKAKQGYLEVLSQGQVKNYPLAIKHINGQITDVIYNASLYKNKDGSIAGIFAAARDITEQKNIETALNKSKEEYAAIFDQSPIAIEFYDSNGGLVNVNRACIDLFGVVNFEEIKGFKLFEDPNITEDIKRKLLNRESVRYESEFDFEKVKQMNLYQTTQSGIKILDFSITSLIKDKSLEGYILQLQDITQRKKQEIYQRRELILHKMKEEGKTPQEMSKYLVSEGVIKIKK